LLYNVVGVRLGRGALGRLLECDAGELTLGVGQQVIVEVEQSTRLATVSVASHRRLVTSAPGRRVLRRATENDLRLVERTRAKEAQATQVCREVLRTQRLAMKLVKVELSLTGAPRAVCTFASDERVDFRPLLRALGQRLQARVELRQVGSRDEAKAVGGIGSCGRELCCTTFLPKFEPISIKVAKDQNIVLNPVKVAGQCGRLKCCLIYEHDTYQQLRKGLPKQGKRVGTPDGEGRVAEVDVLHQRIRVGFGDGSSRSYPAHSVQPMAPPQASPNQPAPAPGRPARDRRDGPPRRPEHPRESGGA
jgi:cell fate regulator YaaT (PSP1 superfamily)